MQLLASPPTHQPPIGDDLQGLRLDNRVALVAGAAQGIGKACAKLLGRRGAKVALFDFNTKLLSEAAAELAADGTDVIALQGDATKDTEADSVVAAVAERWGRLDILINTVGAMENSSIPTTWKKKEDAPPGAIEDISTAAWANGIDQLLNSAFYFSRAAVPHMKANAWGRIVNMSSMAGRAGNGRGINYSTTKAAIIGLTRSTALQLAKTGILVNCVAPVLIVTEKAAHMAEPENVREWLREIHVPLERPATTEEIARLVAFMVSEQMSFTTGYVWDASGGRAY